MISYCVYRIKETSKHITATDSICKLGMELEIRQDGSVFPMFQVKRHTKESRSIIINFRSHFKHGRWCCWSNWGRVQQHGSRSSKRIYWRSQLPLFWSKQPFCKYAGTRNELNELHELAWIWLQFQPTERIQQS